MATISPGTMAVVLEVRLPVTAVGLVSSIVFRLLQKQKLFRVGITSTLLVSLMNVGYLTKYSTFDVWFCCLSAEQHVLAITKSRILILIARIKHTLS